MTLWVKIGASNCGVATSKVPFNDVIVIRPAYSGHGSGIKRGDAEAWGKDHTHPGLLLLLYRGPGEGQSRALCFEA
jgi:hypothetical protein